MNKNTIIVDPKDHNWAVYVASKDDNHQIILERIPIFHQSETKETLIKYIHTTFENKIQQEIIIEELDYLFNRFKQVKLLEYFFWQIYQYYWLLFTTEIPEKINKQIPINIVKKCLDINDKLPYNKKHYQGDISDWNLIEINHHPLIINFYSNDLLN
jgi:hypothetical protein